MKRAIPFVLLAAAAVGGIAAVEYQTADDLRANQRHTAALLRANQIAACRRGNDLRARIQHNNIVVRELFSTAAGARTQAGDVAIAHRYEQLLARLTSQPPVDCTRVIAKP